MMEETEIASAASVNKSVQNSSNYGKDHEQRQAARMIQRNYRGYRERRQLKGIGLDASARWAEVHSQKYHTL